mmetsp:Transcript_24468/g.63784  ORF Transcript_24468/g.63784 Transcript_24468/m.63784 type:complete len:419 (-) Transcript_24468:2364-3620(-)
MDVEAVTAASGKLAAGLITEKEYRHILKVAQKGHSPDGLGGGGGGGSAMSQKDNPFSFNNFDDSAAAGFAAAPADRPKEGKAKRGKGGKGKKKKAAGPSLDDDFDIFAETAPPSEHNPFSFKAYDADAEAPRAAEPAAKPASPAQVGPLPPMASMAADDSEMSSSDSDDTDDDAGGSPQVAAPPPPPKAPSPGADGSDDDSWDSEDNDDGGMLPRPRPAGAAPGGANGGAPAKSDGSVLHRVKRRIMLLKEQLDAKNRELVMAKEQYAMDTEDLREENRSLRKEVKQLRASAAKAEKKASAAASKLKKRAQFEQKEAAVLEDFTVRMEQNLEQTTTRAVAAEAKVADLTEQLERLKAAGVSQGAMSQIKAASRQLKSFSETSEKALKDLMSGAKSLIYVAEILECAEKLAEIEETDSD